MNVPGAPRPKLAVALKALVILIGLGGCDAWRRPPVLEPPPEIDPTLPPGFPMPLAPRPTPELVELGRRLFYDVRLSGNATTSCATCHRQELAFTDGRRVAVGSTGQLHTRNTMSLVNVVYNATYTWADPGVTTLEAQALIPMQNVHPVELGAAGRETEIAGRFAADLEYAARFEHLFPGQDIDLELLAQAIAAFEAVLISGDSPYDHFVYRADSTALSTAERRGMRLFYSERLACSKCHAGFNLSGPVRVRGRPAAPPRFHNTGLYNVDGRGLYPVRDLGLHRHTRRRRDIGRFRAPTLRNVEVTAPYMHDGSIATLKEVIEHYASRAVARGNPLRSELVRGFEITASERRDLVDFLKSLTDERFLTDPRFAAPVPEATSAGR